MSKKVPLKTMIICLLVFMSTSVLWSQKRARVIVGGDFAYPPYEYLDSNGNPTGYNVELSQAIAAEMGFEVQFRMGKWAKVREWLDQGVVDIVQGMAHSPERAKLYHFSIPHTQTWRSVFVRQDSEIKDITDLKMAEVVLQQGDIAEDLLSEIAYRGNRVTVPTQADALHLLNSGKYDAAIVNHAHGYYLMKTLSLGRLMSLPNKLQPRDYCYASHDKNLINEIDAAIAVLSKSGKLKELHDKWFSVHDADKDQQLKDRRQLWWFVAMGLAVLASAAAWFLFLRNKLKMQTGNLNRELYESQTLQNNLMREYKLFTQGPVLVFKASVQPLKLFHVSDNLTRFGYSSETLMKGTYALEELIFEEDRRVFFDELFEAISSDMLTYSRRFRFVGKDGTLHWVMCYMLLNSDPEDRFIVFGFLTEIDKQISLERDLQKAKEAAEAANVAKGYFLANMSHEIRTPLNGIMGFVQVLMHQEQNPSQRKYYEQIYRCGKSIMVLVNEILDFSRLETGRLELQRSNFSPKQMIEDIAKGFIYRREKPHLDIRTNVRSGVPPHVFGDLLRLRQVLINLVQNAIRYTNEGWVEVSADVYTRSDTELRLIFSVSDTGCGINPKKQGDIFDSDPLQYPLIQGTPKESGLGLSIVKKLVGLMNGFIWVESEVGSGSSFFIIIPFVPVQESSVPDISEEIPADSIQDSGVSLNILLVEDEPINQIVTKRLLERWKHRVSVAANGEIAVQMYGKNIYDLILMDIQMPVKDGVSATLEIRELEKLNDRHTPIIAFTAAAMSGDRERFLASGMDDYISKPVDTVLLKQMLNRIGGS